MGVYIKGMEMPTSCARCRCAKGCPAVNDRIARMDEHPWFPCDHRHEDCPLVPVPPHGRLIDADEMRDEWLINGENEYVYDTNAFLESIDNQPTVIPAEFGGAEGK